MQPLVTALAGHRTVAIGGGVVALLVVVGVAMAMSSTAEPTTGVSASQSPSPSPSESPSTTPSPTASATASASASPTPTAEAVATCPLDGMPLPEGAAIVEPALAVQIENHPDARPARNISNADMVVETTVEGDTTRFTGIFLCDATDGMTGPVRSARYYNIDLWQDLHVLTVGFGRSDGAQERFVAAGMPYPNGMDGWPWYQRWGPRAAPHNLYVDLEAMRGDLDTNRALGTLADRVASLRPPFAFAEGPMADEGRAVTELKVATTPSWRFGWTWDDRRGRWLRQDAGKPIEDEVTGERLGVSTLVVQRVTQETVYGDPDPGGNPRRLHHLVGSGTGTVYADGRAHDVRWERQSADDRTTWTFAADGEPVVLPPGPIWWHILPSESRVSEG
jgi:hypothetical protein